MTQSSDPAPAALQRQQGFTIEHGSRWRRATILSLSCLGGTNCESRIHSRLDASPYSPRECSVLRSLSQPGRNSPSRPRTPKTRSNSASGSTRESHPPSPRTNLSKSSSTNASTKTARTSTSIFSRPEWAFVSCRSFLSRPSIGTSVSPAIPTSSTRTVCYSTSPSASPRDLCGPISARSSKAAIPTIDRPQHVCDFALAIEYTLPLRSTWRPVAIVNDELFFVPGTNSFSAGGVFTQNRVQVGIRLPIKPSFAIRPYYMAQSVNLPTGWDTNEIFGVSMAFKIPMKSTP